MITVFARKDKRTKSTYVHHGVKNEAGGVSATADAGWSLRQAIQYEIARLPQGTEYQVERNGVLQ